MFLGLITLAVATLVYRWQKIVDRETAALSELRTLLSRYAVLSNTLFLKQPYVGVETSQEDLSAFYTISDGEIELYTIRDQIYICAPDAVVNAVLNCDKCYRDWKVAYTEESDDGDRSAQREKVMDAVSKFRFAHHKMLLSMREEFADHHSFSIFKPFRSYFSLRKKRSSGNVLR